MTPGRTWTAAALVVGLAGAGGLAADKPVAMDRNVEIEHALSAAPEHLRAGAGVYVLAERGYAAVRPSRNGFTCVAQRAGRVVAPTCFDSEGSATTLQAVLRRGELEAQGKSDAEVEKIVMAEYESGKLLAPRRNGIAYMLSPHFHHHGADGKKQAVFAPHLMFYAPYLKNSDIGSPPEHFNSTSHLFVLGEGKPWAYIIVVPNGTALPPDPLSRPTRP